MPSTRLNTTLGVTAPQTLGLHICTLSLSRYFYFFAISMYSLCNAEKHFKVICVSLVQGHRGRGRQGRAGLRGRLGSRGRTEMPAGGSSKRLCPGLPSAGPSAGASNSGEQELMGLRNLAGNRKQDQKEHQSDPPTHTQGSSTERVSAPAGPAGQSRGQGR